MMINCFIIPFDKVNDIFNKKRRILMNSLVSVPVELTIEGKARNLIFRNIWLVV